MEVISDDTFDQFYRCTQVDAKAFLIDYIDFVELYYPRMVEYYSGLSKSLNAKAFNEFKRLNDQCQILIDHFVANENALSAYEFWILLEQIEDIQAQLLTTSNLALWLRSNQVGNGFSPSPRIPYVASQNQSIEDIELNVTGSSNPEEDWVTTALENNLREEDYTLDGGYLIKIDFKNSDTLNLQSVVDRVDTVEKSYGKDIDRNIGWVDNDLRVLSYKDTLVQSATINSGLRKGDNPAAPNDGIPLKRIGGSTIAGLAYPTIFREMASVFSKDDTFKSFAVTDVKRVQDAIFIDFTVKTRGGDINSSVKV